MTSLKPLSIAIMLACTSFLATGCSSNSVTPTEPVAQNTPTPNFEPTPEPMASIPVEEEVLTQSPEPTETDEVAQDTDQEIEQDMTLAIEDSPKQEMINSERPDTTLFKFGFDKKELNDSDITAIKQHGEYLAKHPDMRITINGHADSQGDATYNDQLSLQRAQYVATLLKDAGVKDEQIEIFSWGSADPLADAKHPRDNRRVELIYGDEYLAKSVF